MVVIASRQTGERPETIRTRLARFMPRAAAAAWSVGWSAQVERADEVGSEDELSAADHIGCYGAAVSHALAKAEVAPSRLQVTAVNKASADGNPQPIVVEVRATIAGAPLDPEIFEGIVRRAAPTCPAWAGLVANPGVRLNAVLDNGDSADFGTTPGVTHTARPDSTPTMRKTPVVAAPMPKLGGGASIASLALPRLAMPAWLTPRMGIMLAVALVVVANLTHHLPFVS